MVVLDTPEEGEIKRKRKSKWEVILLLEEKRTKIKNEDKIKKLHTRQALNHMEETLEKQEPDPCTLTLHSQDCWAFVRTSHVGSHTCVDACVRGLQWAQIQSTDIFRKAGLAFRPTNDLISILKPANGNRGRASNSALQNRWGPQDGVQVFQLADEGRRDDSICVEKGSFPFKEKFYFFSGKNIKNYIFIKTSYYSPETWTDTVQLLLPTLFFTSKLYNPLSLISAQGILREATLLTNVMWCLLSPDNSLPSLNHLVESSGVPVTTHSNAKGFPVVTVMGSGFSMILAGSKRRSTLHWKWSRLPN